MQLLFELNPTYASMRTFFKYVPSTFQLLGGILRTLQRRGFKLQRAAQSDKKGVGARSPLEGGAAVATDAGVATSIGSHVPASTHARAASTQAPVTVNAKKPSRRIFFMLLRNLLHAYAAR